jgi:hypothetical protein
MMTGLCGTLIPRTPRKRLCSTIPGVCGLCGMEVGSQYQPFFCPPLPFPLYVASLDHIGKYNLAEDFTNSIFFTGNIQKMGQ